MSANADRLRECARSIFGQIVVRPHNGVFIAEIGLNETPLTAVAGGVPMKMVAGDSLRGLYTK
jgi:D-aminopeptidase